MDGAIRFINLSHVVLEQDLGAVLDAIIKEVEASKAGIVVVDSFRTVVRKALDHRRPAAIVVGAIASLTALRRVVSADPAAAFG